MYDSGQKLAERLSSLVLLYIHYEEKYKEKMKEKTKESEGGWGRYIEKRRQIKREGGKGGEKQREKEEE